MNIVVLGPDGQLLVGERPRHALARAGPGPGRARHRITFFERDVPYYAAHRDGTDFPGIDLRLYRDLAELRGRAGAAAGGRRRRRW